MNTDNKTTETLASTITIKEYWYSDAKSSIMKGRRVVIECDGLIAVDQYRAQYLHAKPAGRNIIDDFVEHIANLSTPADPIVRVSLISEFPKCLQVDDKTQKSLP
ncbi:MAG TPA: hypothetical protein P5531_10700 [Bacteroidales bacterium]|nr:hypothetical protein [Bacteroidales bacterium]HSA43569.1 hypothetical protein [Bacteroidales bacterium]